MRKKTWFILRMLFLFWGTIFISSCTRFGEIHYFQSRDIDGRVSNYYRLKVDGYARCSSAKYVSGFYDERAVDMFFNEMQIAPTSSTATRAGKLFETDQTNPGTQDKITPLNSTDAGAFVMVLSSNASSVTNVIGQFAENQIVADAVSNLANRDLIAAELRANQATALTANATTTELQKLFALVPDTTKPNIVKTRRAYLRILNSIARGIDPEQDNFDSFKDAEEWLSRTKMGF